MKVTTPLASVRLRITRGRLRLATTFLLTAAPGLVILSGTSARAQTFTFSTIATFNGTDGAAPTGNLAIDAHGDLYGTAAGGGNVSLDYGNGDGVVFEIANTGTAANPTFNSTPTDLAVFQGTNGSAPFGGVAIDTAGNLYGTTETGGNLALNNNYGSGYGTVFEIANTGSASNTSYASLTTLATFNGINGRDPIGNVTLDSYGHLYGTTGGDQYTTGTAFVITAGTAGLIPIGGSIPSTNAGLTVDSNGNLFGTGGGGSGEVFEIANTGSLTHPIYGATQPLTDFDYFNTGSAPLGALVIDKNGNLYGTNSDGGGGGNSGHGTVFELTNIGTVANPEYDGSVTVLGNFTGANGSSPYAGLTLDSAGDLFGTTEMGGTNGDGTVFEIKSGTDTITTLENFSGPNPSYSQTVLTLASNGNLYGTSRDGNGYGSVFELALTNPSFIWNGGGTDNNASTGLNWIGGTSPGPAANDDVTFDGNVRLSPNLEQPYAFNSVTFAATAGSFTLGGSPMTIGAGGITQSSATNLQTIATSGLVLGNDQAWHVAGGGLTVSAPITGLAALSLTATGGGTITFTGNNSYSGGTTILGGTVVVGDSGTNSSSLGTGNVAVDNGSTLIYTASSSAAAAFLNVNVNDTSSVTFQNSATAGKAAINLGGTTSSVLFTDSASAGASTITATGAANSISFLGASSAANSTINFNSPGGLLQFSQNATAGNATINSSSTILFNGPSASLGTSTITLTGNGTIAFDDANASGATIVNNSTSTASGGSAVDVSQGSATNVAVGSLSGSGGVGLGSHTLTLGALGTNDTISGTIQDQAGSGATGGSIVKVGSGTLTLSGANTYTGTTTVEAGTLVIEGSGIYGTAISTGAGSTLNVHSGTIAQTRALNGGVVNIYGGTVAVDASSSGVVNIFAGAIVGAVVGDPATINIYGGTFSNGITNLDPTQSIIDIFGSDFALTDPTLNGSEVDWELTGLLADGETLSTEYIASGDDTSSAQGLTFNGAASAPEPGALSLLLAIVPLQFVLVRKRRV